MSFKSLLTSFLLFCSLNTVFIVKFIEKRNEKTNRKEKKYRKYEFELENFVDSFFAYF